MTRPSRPPRVERRNATFQQWQALLTNRAKRGRAGEMLVQGVRPITMAVEGGLAVRTVLFDGRPRPSAWARSLMDSAGAPVVVVAPDLMAELGERGSGESPELLVVVALPADDLGRVRLGPAPLVVALDRPGNPGNIGTLARSADALGADALVVTGHAADPWDPQAIRASTGSVFAIPVIRLAAHTELLAWVEERRAHGIRFTVVGTDEHGDVALDRARLDGPCVVVVGNETSGMSAAWAHACDAVARIPMGGGASSLNAAVAGSIVLYEASRQRAAKAH